MVLNQLTASPFEPSKVRIGGVHSLRRFRFRTLEVVVEVHGPDIPVGLTEYHIAKEAAT